MSDKNSASIGTNQCDRPDRYTDNPLGDEVMLKLFLLTSQCGHDQDLMILECNNS